MRLLLVEDSERLQRSLGAGLGEAGYALDITGDGEQGLWYAQSHDYDVIILDLMLPGLDGLSILQRLRSQGHQGHVLILTARDTVEDRVLGLSMGADDYLVKPFAFDELLARVQALARRRYGVKNPRLAIGPLEIDTLARTVRWHGAEVKLTAREYALLEYLAMRQGQVVSRSEIESHIYDEQVEPNSNVIDAAVYTLRHKLEQGQRPSIIRTRRGMGYILELGEP
jgi:DNA-binding response OmpR family regulator